MDMQAIYQVVDQLPREALDQLYKYIEHRRSTRVWEVPADAIREIEVIMRPVHERTAHMSEAEINAVIDEAIAEVRRERKTQRGV